MSKKPILGIDLGTTNSLCAVFENGQPSLVPNSLGEFLTPSVVAHMDNGQILVGKTAKEFGILNPDACVARFKRWMGTQHKATLGGKTFSAVELSGMVLKTLREDAETRYGQTLDEAVISVPAYFNDDQRQATKSAGQIAGLNVRRIINEPTAAALTYGFHEKGADKKILVVDLGGGTFDVTLMEIFEGTLEILSTGGESFLGGEDFTDRILSWTLRQRKMNLEVAEFRTPLLVARLREECERAKRVLGNADMANIRVPDEQGRFENAQNVETITLDGYKKSVEDLLDRVRNPIRRVLFDSETGFDEIGEVILVGGATRMPIVRELVTQLFDKEPLCRFDPDEVVALGAAVQAALISDDRAVEDMVVTDVCPFTLGVEIVKDFGNQIRPGYFLPILHRNTTIPVSREEVVFTVEDYQKALRVDVFQGESRRVESNVHLGTLEVADLPKTPKGQPVHIRFTYDINGILEVEVLVPASGKKYNSVLSNNARKMTKDDLDQALKRLQQLKFYPRDDMRNRHLVFFCERIFGEINPYRRQELEEALDHFENAMGSGDRAIFAEARSRLLQTLSALGYEYKESE